MPNTAPIIEAGCYRGLKPRLAPFQADGSSEPHAAANAGDVVSGYLTKESTTEEQKTQSPKHAVNDSSTCLSDARLRFEPTMMLNRRCWRPLKSTIGTERLHCTDWNIEQKAFILFDLQLSSCLYCDLVSRWTFGAFQLRTTFPLCETTNRRNHNRERNSMLSEIDLVIKK